MVDADVLLEWKPPAWEYRNGVIVAYQIRIYLATADMSAQLIHVQKVSVSDEESGYQVSLLADLQAATDYFASVAAYTRAGLGPHSQRVLFTTPEDGTLSQLVFPCQSGCVTSRCFSAIWSSC